MPRQHFTGESEAFVVFPKAPDPGMGRSCAPVWPPEVLGATWAGTGRPQTGLCPLPASGPACSRLRPQSRVPQPPGSPPRPCRGRLGWALGDPAHAGRLPLTRKPKESFGGRSPRGPRAPLGAARRELHSVPPGVTGCSPRARGHVFRDTEGGESLVSAGQPPCTPPGPYAHPRDLAATRRDGRSQRGRHATREREPHGFRG